VTSLEPGPSNTSVRFPAVVPSLRGRSNSTVPRPPSTEIEPENLMVVGQGPRYSAGSARKTARVTRKPAGPVVDEVVEELEVVGWLVVAVDPFLVVAEVLPVPGGWVVVVVDSFVVVDSLPVVVVGPLRVVAVDPFPVVVVDPFPVVVVDPFPVAVVVDPFPVDAVDPFPLAVVVDPFPVAVVVEPFPVVVVDPSSVVVVADAFPVAVDAFPVVADVGAPLGTDFRVGGGFVGAGGNTTFLTNS
jgi:hypothetical protein